MVKPCSKLFLLCFKDVFVTSKFDKSNYYFKSILLKNTKVGWHLIQTFTSTPLCNATPEKEILLMVF